MPDPNGFFGDRDGEGWGGRDERWYHAVMGWYHYGGNHQGAGEQLNYLRWGDGPVVAAIGCGAAALKVAAWHAQLGWDKETAERYVVQVVNNSRGLMLPGLRRPPLAC